LLAADVDTTDNYLLDWHALFESGAITS